MDTQHWYHGREDEHAETVQLFDDAEGDCLVSRAGELLYSRSVGQLVVVCEDGVGKY